MKGTDCTVTCFTKNALNIKHMFTNCNNEKYTFVLAKFANIQDGV